MHQELVALVSKNVQAAVGKVSAHLKIAASKQKGIRYKIGTYFFRRDCFTFTIPFLASYLLVFSTILLLW